MKKTLVLIMVTLAVLVTCMVAFSQEVKIIKGEVIDISCYIAAGAKGMEHKACALACLQAGEPAGILEEGTGKIYIVITADHSTNPSNKVLPYVAKSVEVTGTISERGGVNTIDIKDIKEAGNAPMAMPKEGTGMTKENKGY